MELMIFVVGVLGVFIWVATALLSGNKPKIEGDEFRQNGIVINFANKTVKIGGDVFSTDDVHGIRLNGGVITILVNDLKKPSRSVRIPGWTQKAAADAYDRLALALKKAGCSWK
jgi:hypothetical protein